MRVPVDARRRPHRRRRSQGPENTFVDGRAAADAAAARSRSIARAGRAHVDDRRHSARRSTPGELSDWVHADVPGGAGHQGDGHHAPARHRDGRALLALRVADQHRSREAGDADLASVVLRDLPGEEGRARSRRSASPRTPGRSTKASSTTGRSCSRPTTSIASARRCSSPRSTGCASGSLVCVFDATDRIQHMFWRYIDPAHPAGARARARRRTATPSASSTSTTTRWSAACWRSCSDGDVLMVISDHGFSSFRRGVNLNAGCCARATWRSSPAPTARAEWLRDVDWSRTRAYCLGLTGMFLNLEGPRSAGHRRAGRRGRGAEGARSSAS